MSGEDAESKQIDWLAIEQRIRQIIADQLGVRLADVKDNASFQNAMNADSLDMVEVVMAIEEEFGIQIDDEMIEHVATVRQLVDIALGLMLPPAQESVA